MTLDMIVAGYALAIPFVVVLALILGKIDEKRTKSLKRSRIHRKRRNTLWP